MSRRALLVGINNFRPGIQGLRGCINDTHEMGGLLREYFGFQEQDIKVLHDADATAQRIRGGLGWLLSDYDGDDVRVFHFSSHGTQVDDQGEVTFTIPETDVYMAVQVVNEGGHGLHYVVDDGTHTVKVDSQFAFLIYRSGTEKGLDAARAAQDLIDDDGFKFETYEVKSYDYDDVQRWVERYREETRDYVLEYTFPRSASEITDLHQWNLEVANGWGGSSPEVGVSNKYTNSKFMDGATCYQTTFENPGSVYFTSVTAYDEDRYLFEGVRNVSSYTWTMNRNGTITVSFNCGDEAPNNIDTNGQTFSFTMRYYGVSQEVMDGQIAPTKTVKKGTAPR